jgi:hypothetical protein
MRPFAGSITSDVCRPATFVPRSHQKSLYAADTSPAVPFALRSSTFLGLLRVSNSASSASLANSALSPRLAERSSGVTVP